MKKIKKMIKEFNDTLATYPHYPDDYAILADDFMKKLEQYVKTQQPQKKK